MEFLHFPSVCVCVFIFFLFLEQYTIWEIEDFWNGKRVFSYIYIYV